MKRTERFGIFLVCCLLLCATAALAACSEEPAEVGADTLGLERRIEYVQTNYGEDKSKLYTEDTYARLVTALENATAILQNKSATQAQVDAALTELNDAIENLKTVFKPNYTLAQLGRFIYENLNGNYTLNVTDYLAEGATADKPITYKTYYTQDTRYNEHVNRGYTVFDGYIHTWSYDTDNNVQIGKVYLKNGLPSTYLFDDEMRRVNTSLGGLTDTDIDTSADFVNVAGTNAYATDNDVFFEILSDEILSDYNWTTTLSSVICGVSMEMLENDVLCFTFYGETREDVILSYTVTDIDSTEIEGIAEYKQQNSVYESHGYDGSELLREWNDSYVSDGYRAEFYVYKRAEGRNTDVPDYTVCSVYEASNGGYRYWYVDSDKGVLENAGASLEFTMPNGEVTEGDISSTDIAELNFGAFIISAHDKFELKEKTDEYYYSGAISTQMRSFLDKFFALGENRIDARDIDALSVGINEDGNLTVTLWETYSDATHENRDGMLIRAVVHEKDTAAIRAVEDFLGESETLSGLEKSLTKAEAYLNGNYTQESLNALQSAVDNAQSVINASDRTDADIKNAYDALYAAMQNLVAQANMQSIAALESAVIHAGFYAQADYTQASYSALTTAVADANDLLDSGKYTSAQLYAKQVAIENAIGKLVKSGDKTALAALLAQAKGISVAGKTEASVSRLQTAIAVAEALNQQSALDFDDYTEVMTELNTAIAQLQNKASDATMQDLMQVYNRVKDITNDNEEYTAESFDALKEVCDKVAELQSDMSETEAGVYKKLLEQRESQLEESDYQSTVTVSEIKTAVNILSSGTAFKITYADGMVETYMYSGTKWHYETNQNAGYMWIENLVYKFSLQNGEVVLGGLCKSVVNSKLIATNLAQAGVAKVGTYTTMVNANYSGKESNPLVRIGNSNVFYGSYAAYVQITDKLKNATSFTVELVDGKAVIKVYAGSLQSGLAFFDGSLPVATIEAAQADDELSADISAYMSDLASPRVSANDVASAFEALGNNYGISDVMTGLEIVMNDTYFFDGTSGYALIDGSVKCVYNVNGEIKVGGEVYVDNEKAVSIAQVVKGLSAVKYVEADDLLNIYNDWSEEYEGSYYAVMKNSDAVDEDFAKEILALLNYEYDEDDGIPEVRFTVIGNGVICISVWEMTVRPENFYTVAFGVASNSQLDALTQAA